MNLYRYILWITKKKNNRLIIYNLLKFTKSLNLIGIHLDNDGYTYNVI